MQALACDKKCKNVTPLLTALTGVQSTYIRSETDQNVPFSKGLGPRCAVGNVHFQPEGERTLSH